MRAPTIQIDLAAHWAIAQESAERHGKTVRREDWRLVVPIYLADTRAAAFEEARHGAGRFLLEYVEGVTGRPRPVPGPADMVIDQMTEVGGWIVGTPDDAIAAIKHLQERSGGFGGLLIWGHDWASRECILRSYDLFARHVIPHFDGSITGTQASNRVVTAKSATLGMERTLAVEAAQKRYEDGAQR